ncbi:MAG: 50S ribosomal protein L19 [Candidatus Nealsonbacteria bacterium]|nr:50S ribosomal protein L19 [Candidatus Nealsonbacteria bacterium]
MKTKLETFIKLQSKINLADIRPGDTVKVYQKIPVFVKAVAGKKKDLSVERKEKVQVFEGMVLARKHGKEIGATITVRKVISGIGCEKIFPLHSPLIEKIEILKRGKVRRAKLYYLRKAKGKRAKLKKGEFIKDAVEEKPEKEKTER